MNPRFLMTVLLEVGVWSLLTLSAGVFGTWLAHTVGADSEKPVSKATLTLNDGTTVTAHSKAQLDQLTAQHQGQFAGGLFEYGVSEATQVAEYSTSCFLLLGFGAWVYFHHRQQLRAWLKPTWRAIGYGLLAAVVAKALAAVVAILVEALGVQLPRLDLQAGNIGTIPIVFVFAAVIAAPVAEELYWRGRLLELFGEKIGRTAAVILTALGFALVHMAGATTFLLIPVGLVLGYVRYKSEGLVAPIVAHAAINGSNIIVTLLAGAKS